MKKNNISIILILSILISFICGSLGAYFILKNNPSTNTIIKNHGVTLNESNSISPGVEAVYDSVVVVEGFTKGQLASTGTGFIYKENKGTAYIMTNHHVISGVESVKIILSNKTVINAEIRGSEAYSDIAVLAVTTDKTSMKVATLGDSTKLRVGDTLFTVGSPEGADYAGTVTKGILSGAERLVAVALTGSNTSDYYMKVLQTDAAINPGNSGGPICNINGEVIGITNMKLVDSTVEGMGFAIPIEDALFYAATLEKGENVVRPYFGIGMLDAANSYYLWQNGIVIDDKIDAGVVVLEVADNSPASEAKLKKGDIIISLGGEDISSIAEFRYELYQHQVGEVVEVQYIRGGKKKTAKVKLTENKQ